jgi:hypothetical protein
MKIITTRSVKWIVGPVDESVYSDELTSVEILDEGAGEFVQISQRIALIVREKIKISPEEWPELRNAIDQAIKMCKEMPK